MKAYYLKMPVARRGALLVIRLCGGTFLVWTGLAKVRQPFSFFEQVLDYDILPIWAAHGMAAVLPVVEVGVGLALLLGVFLSGSCALLLFLGMVFAGAQISALARGLSIDCGCTPGAPGEALIGVTTVLRALTVAAAGAVGLILLRLGAARRADGTS